LRQYSTDLNKNSDRFAAISRFYDKYKGPEQKVLFCQGDRIFD